MRKRLRSTIKWSGTVLTALLLVVWVGSVFGFARIGGAPPLDVGIQDGVVFCAWEKPWTHRPFSLHYTYGRTYSHWRWARWFYVWTVPIPNGTCTTVYIPIWFVAALTGLPTVWLWRRDRRRLPGLCIKCGYDLRGAPHTACPECGAATGGCDQ